MVLYPSSILVSLVLGITSLAKVVPLIQPGFFFDYDIPGQPIRIPITTQCERIHIKWGRNGAIGQNPTAPYFLQVFTSTATTPFIIHAGDGLTFDWDVPFAPGTQYQICMFDTNGVPGGCQAMYTVVQNTTITSPVCQNVTAPPQLAIAGTVAGGPISQYGFIDQCTDISITPRGGKPPFTLTVSPPLHPPYNITSNNMDPIVWTVSLSWSYPFFMSLVSSDGQMWANGPMHAGGLGPSDCLAPGTVSHRKAAQTAAGASVGALIAGVILGIGGFWLVTRRQRKGFARDLGRFREFRDKDTASIASSDFDRPLPPIPRRLESLGSVVEGDPYTRPTRYHRPIRSPSVQPETPTVARTYVVHYDGGSIRTSAQESGEVIELPPEYDRRGSVISTSATASSSAMLAELQPVRMGKAARYS